MCLMEKPDRKQNFYLPKWKCSSQFVLYVSQMKFRNKYIHKTSLCKDIQFSINNIENICRRK